MSLRTKVTFIIRHYELIIVKNGNLMPLVAEEITTYSRILLIINSIVNKRHLQGDKNETLPLTILVFV